MQSVSIQPAPVPHMVTTVTQMSRNDWSSGICDCCEDMGICCLAFWCFPCFQCSTVNDFGECLCLPLLEHMSSDFPIISLAMRTAVRERHKIPGSIFSDCCTVCWCLSCSWCQMAREIKTRRKLVTFMTAHTTPAPMMYTNKP
ncbi:cornifelin-like [Bufo bufo]|uniref:cornifelin-like n=1 Tax=Bufo bufo TaxID=8384 RepID=UPI001ABEB0E0|nr:cornifelin-like [Bufo bufo]